MTILTTLNSEIHLTPMSFSDLDEVCELENQTQNFSWTRGQFYDALKANYGAWILKKSDQLLGLCVLMFAPDVGHLLAISVHPNYHRQKLGTRLLLWCEAQAREHGLEATLLEVRISNRVAIKFYEGQGYARIGRRNKYYKAAHNQREDAWVMQKNLFSLQNDDTTTKTGV